MNNHAHTPKRIVQLGNPVLREIAQPVAVEDISTPKIKKIIEDMRVTLANEHDGVGIAAPQIGVPLAIFLISGKALSTIDERYSGKDMVFINPYILRASKEKDVFEEGCLSVRWQYGRIKRSNKVTIRAHDENGKMIERGASGLLAQIFQHEIDHLQGTLFIDNAYDIVEIPPEEQSGK